EKILVQITRSTTLWALGEDVWISEEDVYHSRNSMAEGAYSIVEVGGGITLTGIHRGIVNQNLEIQGYLGVVPIGQGNQQMESTITITDEEGHTGTFEGILHYRGDFGIPQTGFWAGYLIPFNAVSRGVWHGTGDFQGWTYVLEYEIINGGTPSPLVGYLLIP
ncbi:MAG TPA: hypothetical protein VF893_00695, partial [Candidatus Bathyarchaeia archaeon]